jgi:4-hydroxybenzoate polyprenyltransferase
MTALQFAIGALNDLADAGADAGRKPHKPIPAGLVSPRAAAGIAAVAASGGVLLAIPSGLSLVLLALVVLGIGASYDLAAKGTPLSWLPFAVGIPLLPLYGWLGTTGEAPGWFAVLWPAAFLAGAALAIANARVDVERDLAAGRSSVAAWLGLERSWWVSLALILLALGIVVVWRPAGIAAPAVAAVTIGVGFVLVGALRARRPSPAEREGGWRLQAVGVGVVAVGWISAVTT